MTRLHHGLRSFALLLTLAAAASPALAQPADDSGTRVQWVFAVRTAGDVSAEWALWQSRPYAEVDPARRTPSVS